MAGKSKQHHVHAAQASQATESASAKSRAMKTRSYFESGSPYAHDQWISHAGTAWATIGLAAAGTD